MCGTAGLATLSLALLSGLAGDAEPGANLRSGVATGAQALMSHRVPLHRRRAGIPARAHPGAPEKVVLTFDD
jgi:hypothetical protein